jgi:serine/threonine-protein kinase
MKLATGGTLASRAANYAGCWRAIAALLVSLAQATAFAHERGVLHRDIKPGNVLFDESDRAYLADFGLAKMLDSVLSAPLTQSLTLMGTPQYLAPELAESGASKATVASDVYGLGAIFYELLAQRPPFQAAKLTELIRAVCHDDPPPFSVKLSTNTTANVPRDLEIIVRKCLRKDPAERYATATALATDLQSWLAGEPIAARPTTVFMRLKAWSRRRPALAAGLAVLAVSLASGAAAQWRALRHTQAAQRNAESLVEYLNGTLTDKLAPTGRLDLISSVNQRLEQWYAEQPADRVQHDPAFALQQARFLYNQARADYPAGDYVRAEQHLNTALQIAEAAKITGSLLLAAS